MRSWAKDFWIKLGKAVLKDIGTRLLYILVFLFLKVCEVGKWLLLISIPFSTTRILAWCCPITEYRGADYTLWLEIQALVTTVCVIIYAWYELNGRDWLSSNWHRSKEIVDGWKDRSS
jgi:hypothetical protein